MEVETFVCWLISDRCYKVMCIQSTFDRPTVWSFRQRSLVVLESSCEIRKRIWKSYITIIDEADFKVCCVKTIPSGGNPNLNDWISRRNCLPHVVSVIQVRFYVMCITHPLINFMQKSAGYKVNIDLWNIVFSFLGWGFVLWWSVIVLLSFFCILSFWGWKLWRLAF